MIKAIFFDLDGTLLPLDMDVFIPKFFEIVAKSGSLEVINNDMESFKKAVFYMLLEEHEGVLNEEAFNLKLEELTGVSREKYAPVFKKFYDEQYEQIKEVVGFEPICVNAVKEARRKGYKVVLATNPVFPVSATNMRIGWAGLTPSDFDYITYMDNTYFCKPNSKYFADILKHMGLNADEAIMIGNCPREDGCAQELGIPVYIIKTHIDGIFEGKQCLLNDYSDLEKLINDLPSI